MKIGYKYIIPIFFILGNIFFTSCKKGIPSEIIQPDKMEAVLYDYHIAQAMGNEYNGEERYKKELLVQYVFKKYNTTEAQFDSSLIWYTRNTEELNKIYEHVNERLKQSNDIIAKTDLDIKTKSHIITGDSVDIWYHPKLYKLSNKDLTNKIVFTIPTDTSYRIQDYFVWEINSLPLKNKTINLNTEAELSIQYQNDSISSINKCLVTGKNELCIQTDTLPIKEIRGFIYYNGDSLDNNTHALIIYDVSLMRYHSSRKIIKKQIAPEKEKAIAIEKDTIQKTEKKDTMPIKGASRLSPKELKEQNRPKQIQKNRNVTGPIQ